MSQLVELHTLVGGLDGGDPSTGAALLAADPKDLSRTARSLRRHIVDALKSTERPRIHSPSALYDVLGRGQLRPIEGRWNSYALDRDRHTVRVERPQGGTRNLLVVSHKVPYADDLPPLRRGGRWLVLWHGGPQVLSIDGVPARLAHLRRRTPCADVVFYDPSDRPASLWSLGLGHGSCGGTRLEFPDELALSQAKDTP